MILQILICGFGIIIYLEIFDCGTGTAKSFVSVANIVLNFLKKRIQYIPMPNNIQKKHYQTFTQANLLQLRKIGYPYSFIDIYTGINKYLNWLNNC